MRAVRHVFSTKWTTCFITRSTRNSGVFEMLSFHVMESTDILQCCSLTTRCFPIKVPRFLPLPSSSESAESASSFLSNLSDDASPTNAFPYDRVPVTTIITNAHSQSHNSRLLQPTHRPVPRSTNLTPSVLDIQCSTHHQLLVSLVGLESPLQGQAFDRTIGDQTLL